jgi:hypothetical protein
MRFILKNTSKKRIGLNMILLGEQVKLCSMLPEFKARHQAKAETVRKDNRLVTNVSASREKRGCQKESKMPLYQSDIARL